MGQNTFFSLAWNRSFLFIDSCGQTVDKLPDVSVCRVPSPVTPRLHPSTSLLKIQRNRSVLLKVWLATHASSRWKKIAGTQSVVSQQFPRDREGNFLSAAIDTQEIIYRSRIKSNQTDQSEMRNPPRHQWRLTTNWFLRSLAFSRLGRQRIKKITFTLFHLESKRCSDSPEGVHSTIAPPQHSLPQCHQWPGWEEKREKVREGDKRRVVRGGGETQVRDCALRTNSYQWTNSKFLSCRGRRRRRRQLQHVIFCEPLQLASLLKWVRESGGRVRDLVWSL